MSYATTSHYEAEILFRNRLAPPPEPTMGNNPGRNTPLNRTDDMQRLLGKPSTVPMSALLHPPLSTSAPTAPLSSPSHTSSRIERALYRDPVGEQIVTTTSTKCTYLGIIEVTRHLFQEAGTTCVECPACGARRTLKSPKDRPHFPSHPRRLTLPPKGERRWIERKEIWKVVED
jgi:hypothetical protein